MSIHSDWGAWLPQRIADTEPNGVQLWYLGCNGIALKAADGTTVFVDPYLGTGDPPRTVRMIPVPFEPTDVHSADAILATHEHVDHVHGPSQAPILAETDGCFYGPDKSVAVAREEERWPETYGVHADQLRVIEEGDLIEIGAFTVHVEPAHDPDAVHPVTYLIEHESGTIFHGGDTKPTDEFVEVGETYDIDIGVLAYGTEGMILDRDTREPTRTKWYCNENELVAAAESLQLERLLPSHWDMWKGLTADPTSLHRHVASFEYPRKLELLEIGDETAL